MAFKKVDFSKLDRTMARVDPLDSDDLRLFEGQNIHRGVVDLTWDRRAEPDGDQMIVALTDKGEAIELRFEGHRADLYREGLERLLYQRWVDVCDDAIDQDIEMPGSRDIAMPLIVEGAWRPRFWRDRHGTQHKTWQLVAARWHYTPDPENQGRFIEDGRLPKLKEKAA